MTGYSDDHVRRYIRYGVFVALIIIVQQIAIGALIHLSSFEHPVLDELRPLYDPPWGIALDILTLLSIAYFLHRSFRGAAIILVIYILASTLAYPVLLLTESFPLSYAIVDICLLLAMLFISYRALRATFIYQSKQPPKQNFGISIWVWAIIGFCTLIFTLLLILGYMVIVGILPSGKLELANGIPSHVRQELLDYGMIAEEQPIDYFYSYGVMDWMDGGTMMTDTGIIDFVKDDELDENGNPFIYVTNVPYEDIHGLTLQHPGSMLEDAVYIMRFHYAETGECDETELWLSTELGRHKAFVSKLKNRSPNLGIGKCVEGK